MDFERILVNAHAAARSAVVDCEQANPESNSDPCGFAWVVIDGTSSLARWCRAEIKRRTKAHARPEHITSDTVRILREAQAFCGNKNDPTGWKWWKPGNFNGQAIRIHEVGSRAFRHELAKHGISATVHSRLD